MITLPKTVVSLLVLLALSGCLQVAGLQGSPESSDLGSQVDVPGGVSAPGPEPFPPEPSELTPESVGEYVEAHETVYEELRILREASVDVTDVGVECTSVSVSEADDTFGVEVECVSWYEFQDGDAVGIADGAGHVAVYEVSDDGIERIEERSLAS